MNGYNFLPLIFVLVLLVFRIPCAISFLSGTFLYFLFYDHSMTMNVLVQKMITSNMSFTLLALPFFILVGIIMNRSGISKRMMNFCNLLVGHLPGGLAQVNVLMSTLLGGICGSAGADCAMESKMLVPEMERHGYDKPFAAVVTAASSLISPIIPPGTGLILYAVAVDCSVLRMFMAGYVPGVFLCIGMMIVVHIVSLKRGYGKERDKIAPAKEILKAAWDSKWAIILPIFLVWALRSGFFTPTEAGAVLVLLCTLVGLFAYKEFSLKDIPSILREAVDSTANTALICISATLFGFYMTWEGIPQAATEFITTICSNRFSYLLVVNIFLLLMGMIMDATPLTMLAAPILWPSAQTFGIDVIQFGIMMIVNLSIGSLTPPYGALMYQSCHYNKVELPAFLKDEWLFLIPMFIVLMMLAYVPGLATWLPNLIYGS